VETGASTTATTIDFTIPAATATRTWKVIYNLF
jgi:hypothetical protein